MKNFSFGKLPLLTIIIITLGIVGLTYFTQNVQAHVGYHNAMKGRDGTASGAWSYITWTNPDLHGGPWSFHRIAVAQWSPWRFIETGWVKTSDYPNLRGNITYDNGSGPVGTIYTGISSATHRYSVQYVPGSGKFWCYVDGSAVYNVNAGFTSGNVVLAGSEVSTGVEEMNNTHFYDLRYISSPGTGYRNWNGYSTYVEDSPYYTTNDGLNAFYTNP